MCKVRVLDIRYGNLDNTKTDPSLQFVGVGDDPLHGGMADRKVVNQAVRGVEVIYHLAINWDGFTWRHKIPLGDLFDTLKEGSAYWTTRDWPPPGCSQG